MKVRYLTRYGVDQFINAGFHLGSDSKKWVSKTSYFLSALRKRRFLFDVNKSVFMFRRALLLFQKIVFSRGLPLFLVGERYKKLLPLLEKLQFPAISGRYKIGSISNYRTIQPLRSLPALLIILDHFEAGYAAREASMVNLPTVGFSDSDMDPTFFSYPLPANNDSIVAVELFLSLLLRSVFSARFKELTRMRVKRASNRPIRRVPISFRLS